jgi:RNA polymerase sigma-70 factor (ECF subfamily)
MDRILVERAMGGDHSAFAELAYGSADRLLRIARLILRDELAAEDATQEALVGAWRHIRGLREPDRFDAWLSRLLVNACRKEAARGRSRRTREIHLPAADPTEPDETNHVLDRDQLDRGFRQLDVNHRAVVVLYYYVGLRPDEAAEVLGWPAGTVRSRLQRAIQQMRATLDADARLDLQLEGRAE